MDELTSAVCVPACDPAAVADVLNRTCFCVGVDTDALRRRLEVDLARRGLAATMAVSHPHLFSSLPVFVSRGQLQQMARVIAAVESVIATASYRNTVLSWAPEVARFEPGPRGGLLSYDFHLSESGPQLIEINTNPGGALLNAMLGPAQRDCCNATAELASPVRDAAAGEQRIFEVIAAEWHQQRPAAALRTVAIVDVNPEGQYLYPEFLLYRELFRRNGLDAFICEPGALARRDGRLFLDGVQIDFVYNRLTDFALQEPASAHLRSAYLNREVVVSPHPRAHALYADKRNFSLLSDEQFLRAVGIPAPQLAVLSAGVPCTEIVTPGNRDELWARRDRLFFKPAAGFGGKAAYRGDKLTRRVWDEMQGRNYVAQALVKPSLRTVGSAATPVRLKVDVRTYAYAAEMLLVAARLYQGQTTNFRTPGGGFSPVLTSAEGAAAS